MGGRGLPGAVGHRHGPQLHRLLTTIPERTGSSDASRSRRGPFGHPSLASGGGFTAPVPRFEKVGGTMSRLGDVTRESIPAGSRRTPVLPIVSGCPVDADVTVGRTHRRTHSAEQGPGLEPWARRIS